ncbi:MAG TPA: hypothetical protein VMU47_07350 [Caldimonas sp.]|nr:hypothetical protein [Caldimonas sp.]
MRPVLTACVRAAFGAVLLACAVQSTGATGDISPSGFIVTLHAETTASRGRVYEALVHPERWWNPRHTWSGASANLSLAAEASGCWCERWEGNSVEHGRVVFVRRGEVLRLNAALGPLQALAVDAVLTFSLADKEGRTLVDVSYRVSGNASAGLDRLAAPVEGVLDEQLRRLVRVAEGGTPE